METQISRSIIEGYTAKLTDCLDIDLAIVGAGPSGLLAAYYVAKAGKKVAVFERKLAPGGGAWGGAMLFNDIIVQQDASHFLDEIGVRHQPVENDMVRADSVEFASALIYKAVNAGARLFNSVTVEDVMFKHDRICGVVINYTPILMANLHVDPLCVRAKAVLDGTGHDASLTAGAARKAGIRLNTPSGTTEGEKPMWAEVGERTTVENTREVFPGLFVSGMAANGVYGTARMGPIFGGMLKSGKKAADEIVAAIERQA